MSLIITSAGNHFPLRWTEIVPTIAVLIRRAALKIEIKHETTGRKSVFLEKKNIGYMQSPDKCAVTLLYYQVILAGIE